MKKIIKPLTNYERGVMTLVNSKGIEFIKLNDPDAYKVLASKKLI